VELLKETFTKHQNAEPAAKKPQEVEPEKAREKEVAEKAAKAPKIPSKQAQAPKEAPKFSLQRQQEARKALHQTRRKGTAKRTKTEFEKGMAIDSSNVRSGKRAKGNIKSTAPSASPIKVHRSTVKSLAREKPAREAPKRFAQQARKVPSAGPIKAPSNKLTKGDIVSTKSTNFDGTIPGSYSKGKPGRVFGRVVWRPKTGGNVKVCWNDDSDTNAIHWTHLYLEIPNVSVGTV
jgi:hypothetical protein